MPKLGKEKFTINGYHNPNRTTFSGDVELYLYYDITGNYFYFDKKEIEKYFFEEIHNNSIQHLFHMCDTKEKAIGIIVSMLDKDSVEKKMLRIELSIPSIFYMVSNPNYSESEMGSQPTIINPEFPQFLIEMLGRRAIYEGKGISLNFERIMMLENRNKSTCAICDKNWKYTRNNIYGYSSNLIEWTQEREIFLIEFQKKLDLMAKNVLDFFNAKDIDDLTNRMINSSRLKRIGL